MNTEDKKQLASILERAESNLADNVMPFWADHTWDEEYGGFLTRLDRRGRRLDAREKILMMQIRMIASLSSAHRFGIRDRGYLELAGNKWSDFLSSNHDVAAY
jgi:mannose/cellobiose epimerase-like protein (N-acyl-D-glucosamine 2-epimerase family)